MEYSKTRLKQPLKNRQNKDVNDKWYLNEGPKYCRMLPLEHSALLLTCIMGLSVLKINFGILFEWLLKTGFTEVEDDVVLLQNKHNDFASFHMLLLLFQLLMKSPQKRLVDLYALQNTLFFKTCNFTDVIEKKVSGHSD